MLIYDFRTIGNRMLAFRKRMGLTQAGLSDRAYADIECGNVNMRVETVLRICAVLHVTPDELLTDDSPLCTLRLEELLERLNTCSPRNRETALALLTLYLKSLD